MLDLLNEQIRHLPNLLDDIEGWDSLIINRRKPVTWRAFRMIGENRLCLHKFEQFDGTTEEAFPHTHPWPGAFRIISGGYRMQVGKVESINDVHGQMLATFDMWEGSSYEMTNPLVMHRVTPITSEVYTIMINGPAWPEGVVHSGVKTTKGKDLQAMSRGQLRDHLHYFKRHFAFENRRIQ